VITGRFWKNVLVKEKDDATPERGPEFPNKKYILAISEDSQTPTPTNKILGTAKTGFERIRVAKIIDAR